MLTHRLYDARAEPDLSSVNWRRQSRAVEMPNPPPEPLRMIRIHHVHMHSGSPGPLLA